MKYVNIYIGALFFTPKSKCLWRIIKINEKTFTYMLVRNAREKYPEYFFTAEISKLELFSSIGNRLFII